MGFFDKIKEGLRKTKEAAASNVNAVLATFRKVDEEMLSELRSGTKPEHVAKKYGMCVSGIYHVMKRYGIPIENVVRHYDISGKYCPGIIGWNINSGSDAAWRNFKTRLKAMTAESEEIDMTEKEMIALIDKRITEKLNAIATRIYHADGVDLVGNAPKQLKQLEDMGFGSMPICMAKTQYSFSDDPTKLGAPEDFTVTIKNVKVSAGAGFLVVLTGDIMTMPGLPKVPAAERIDVDENGVITGLF